MQQIILVNRYDVDKTIIDEKEQWVIKMLEFSGIHKFDLENINYDLFISNNIEIIDHKHNGDIEILHNNILIAKWYAPQLIAKYDENNIIYYEIHLDYDSIFDNNADDNNI